MGALADATRRSILSRLKQGEATISEIAQPFSMSLPAISKHLSVLEQAGLITRSNRGRERVCAARPGAIEPVADWVKDYQSFWTGSLESLDNYFNNQKETTNEHNNN